MTTTLYPQGRTVESIKDGVATVVWGAARCNTSIVSDEELKTEFGGMAESRYTESNLRRLWTPKEKKNHRDFMRLYGKYVNARIPVIRQEMKGKMLARFGTTNPKKYEATINAGLLSNPRLDITKKDGRMLHVSVSEQKAYSEQRSALGLEGRKS